MPIPNTQHDAGVTIQLKMLAKYSRYYANWIKFCDRNFFALDLPYSTVISTRLSGSEQ